MRTRTLVVLAAGGLVLAAVGTAFVLASDHEDNKGAFLSLALTVGLSFLASGVIALWRRPDNRTGTLFIAVAYLWFLGALTESNNDWIFTLGVGKHANASNVAISLARHDGVIVIAVEDDGSGGADSAGGSGLRGLADRVEALGGRLEVVSPSGGGTALTAVIPDGS